MDERDNGVDRRHGHGRRTDDASRNWKDYAVIVVNVAAIVWGAATLSATVSEIRAITTEHTVQIDMLRTGYSDLRAHVNVLDCRTGITCRVDSSNSH